MADLVSHDQEEARMTDLPSDPLLETPTERVKEVRYTISCDQIRVRSLFSSRSESKSCVRKSSVFNCQLCVIVVISMPETLVPFLSCTNCMGYCCA